jgi:serine/threonine protein kinase/tetratricopeptide (TPR) repeat protein
VSGNLTSLTFALADRYRIERELGAGGMATVYLAHDLRHDRKVALKILRPDVALTLGADRFLREIQLVARLSHPHILPLFDSGEAEGALYYVMPNAEGASLRDRLDQVKTLPVDEALRITSEVADALDYAHRRNVVHRDIKPENILLHEGHAMVADFGIGKALASAAKDSSTFTQIGVTVGTPAYMSPEQATGDDVDGRSDLFSLGCVLYEMLAGEVAFTGPSAQATIAKRFMYSPPPVASGRPEVPQAVSDAVARLLAREPAERHSTGAQVVTDLRQAATGSVAARPVRESSDKSIAVLPFANLSAEPENEFFSDGLTEEIITDLSGVKALRVISRNSSMQKKGSKLSLRDIGRELGVRYLLTGGVRKAGNALRITAQLVESETDAPVWADKYSGTMDDVFDVQERVSRAIVGALQVQLSASEESRLAARPIQNPRAFEAFLRARDELRRWGNSTDRAAQFIQQAIEIEGESPALRALKAFMLYSQVRAGMSTVASPLDVMESEARGLIQLNPDAPFGHALLGFVNYERGLHPDAVRHLTRALELDPTDSDALFCLGISYQSAGQVQASIEVAARFLRSDPLSPFAWVLTGVAQWFGGNIGGQLDAIKKACELDPESPIIRWSLGYTYALVGRLAEARVQAEWIRERAPEMPYSRQLTSVLDGLEGRPAAALETLQRVDLRQLDAHHTFHISESYAMAGDTTRSLQLLERAVDRGFYPVRFIAEYCAFMEPLHGMEEFDRIVAKAERRVREFSA